MLKAAPEDAAEARGMVTRGSGHQGEYSVLPLLAALLLSCNDPLSGFWDQDQPEFFRPSRKLLHDALAMLALIVVLPHIDVLRTMFEHAIHQVKCSTVVFC